MPPLKGPAFLILYDHRGLYKSILWSIHTSSHLVCWAALKIFFGYSIGASWQGQGNTRYLQDGHIIFSFVWLIRLGHCLAWTAGYHTTGKAAMEQLGGGGAWMTHYVLMFWAHEVFSVVSDSLG